MSDVQQQADRKNARNAWALSAPALVVLTLAAAGPLLIILVYSFLLPGKYGNVEWGFSFDAWRGILVSKDIFDGTYKLADAHLTIFWRSVKLSLMTTVFTFVVGFPTAWFIATRSPKWRAILLFLITIPFWTNLLIRTFAINQIIRNEGLFNTAMIKLGFIDQPIVIIYTDFAVFLG
ncbi:MAG: ABC transporter permease, partial [Paracoccaceae bacterium]|nr:ABC transporter permease [Paracoccaceae bacterium]